MALTGREPSRRPHCGVIVSYVLSGKSAVKLVNLPSLEQIMQNDSGSIGTRGGVRGKPGR